MTNVRLYYKYFCRLGQLGRLFRTFYLNGFLLTNFEWESVFYSTNSDMPVQFPQKNSTRNLTSDLGVELLLLVPKLIFVKKKKKKSVEVLLLRIRVGNTPGFLVLRVFGAVFVHCLVRSWGLKPLTRQSLRHWLLGNHQAPPTAAGSPYEPGAAEVCVCVGGGIVALNIVWI